MKIASFFISLLFVCLQCNAQIVLKGATISGATLGSTNAASGGGGGGSPLITSGLLAYYKFDENTGTSASDASGNSHTGTLSGSTVPSWDSPYIGISSLLFNGSTAYVNVPTSASLEPGSGDFSIMFWVKSTTPGTEMLISMYTGSLGDYYFIRLNGSGLIDAVFQGQHGGPSDVNGAVVITDGSWHLVVVTLTSMVTRLYVDAVLDGTSGVTTGGPVSPGVNLNFATYQNGAGQFFPGNLDEVGFYSRVLTGTEMTNLKNQGHP